MWRQMQQNEVLRGRNNGCAGLQALVLERGGPVVDQMRLDSLRRLQRLPGGILRRR